MSQPKLGWIFFTEQLKWTVWFYIIITIIFAGVVTVNNIFPSIEMNDVLTNNNASGVYMLIIGLLYSYGFLDYYFKNGVTRKRFFQAALFSSALLSTVLGIAMMLMLIGFEFIIPMFGSSIPWPVLITEGGVASLIKIMVDYSIIHLFYLLIGWFIGLGFYRFRWKIGLLFIMIVILLFGITAILQGQTWSIPTINLFSSNLQIVRFAPYLLFFALIAILTLCNYRLTKDAPIRIRL